MFTLLCVVAVGGMVSPEPRFDRAGRIDVEHPSVRAELAREAGWDPRPSSTGSGSGAAPGTPAQARHTYPRPSSPSQSREDPPRGSGATRSDGADPNPADDDPPEPTAEEQAAFFEVFNERIGGMIDECYENVAPEGLAGTLMLSFDLQYDPETGGVVVESGLREESPVTEPALVECVAETVKSIELPTIPGHREIWLTLNHDFPPESKGEGEGGN